MSLLTDKEIREALKPVGITPGNVLYEVSRAIEKVVMRKLQEQKPVAKVDINAPCGIAFTAEGAMLEIDSRLLTIKVI